MQSPQPLSQRAQVAAIVLGLVVVGSLVSLWADIGQLDLVNRALGGERVGLAEATRSDDRVTATAIVVFALYVLSAITFLLWYGRAYRNIEAMGVRNPRWSWGWAIGYWFIPIVALFRPKQVVNDIWRGSDPDLATPAPVGWEGRPVHALIHWWWGLWLLSNFVSRFGSGAVFSDDPPTTRQLHDDTVGYIVADVLTVVAAGFAIAVLGLITARQQRRIERFAAGELPVSLPPPLSDRPPGPRPHCRRPPPRVRRHRHHHRRGNGRRPCGHHRRRSRPLPGARSRRPLRRAGSSASSAASASPSRPPPRPTSPGSTRASRATLPTPCAGPEARAGAGRRGRDGTG